ncbi:PfkB family carbohydrate kinase [Paracoccaceae bacterium]|nr:PfkB family carbohydrate kinase [Paracoccaceae bacterium]
MTDELKKAYERKIFDVEKLKVTIGGFGRENKVILCHGVFDIVHPGHIRHLAYAKSKADILIVSITCDNWVDKGAYRPHVPQNLRALSLAALDMVDYVIIDDNEKPLENLYKLQPDYFAKGFEYSGQLPEATEEEMLVVNNYGGSLVFTPGDVVYSSSKLINTHAPSLMDAKLSLMMAHFDLTFDKIRSIIDRFEGIKVHVVGDAIIDSYTRTNLIGGGLKTPTFSVSFESKDNYVGGAGVVAKHMKAAGADVMLTTLLGEDDLGEFAIADLGNSGIILNNIAEEARPTTNKNVIIADGYRLLKVDTLDNAPLRPETLKIFIEKISQSKTDCVVFSDFRHGIFNKKTIKLMSDAIPSDTLKVADSQVASRWGNITEFFGFDLITPNEREARFSMGDQEANIARLISKLKDTTQSNNVILKLGEKGMFLLCDDSYYSIDSFAGTVKDAVGAGDALLAYSTLALKISDCLPSASLIGSIAAACECEYDGNIPISPDQILTKIDKIENAFRG